MKLLYYVLSNKIFQTTEYTHLDSFFCVLLKCVFHYIDTPTSDLISLGISSVCRVAASVDLSFHIRKLEVQIDICNKNNILYSDIAFSPTNSPFRTILLIRINILSIYLRHTSSHNNVPNNNSYKI